jgi:hypothetical protein
LHRSMLVAVALSAASVIAPVAATAQDQAPQGAAQATPSPTPTASPRGCASVVTPVGSPSAEPTAEPSPIPCPSPTPIPDGDIGPRPYGLAGLKSLFGRRCNNKTNDARTYMPSAWGRGDDGYVYYHALLAPKVTDDVLAPLLDAGKDLAFDYGIWGYACRLKTGGTSWSVHSWGAAIDTNTLRNPFGQTWWNGKGSNGQRFGKLLPNAYMNQGFYWGINFSDPMHFQYVSGY